MRLLKEIIWPILIGAILALVFRFVFFQPTNYSVPETTENVVRLESSKSVVNKDEASKVSRIKLSVPFVSEAPDGDWSGPWKNACEEASIAMVEFFYKGKKTVSISEAKSFMQNLFDFQNSFFGFNNNSDAKNTLTIINNKASFSGRIVENPSIEDIKKEVREGRPVITFNHGFTLNNPNVPFLATGSSFHALVVIGYDDAKKSFIVNDDGDTNEGAGYLYKYSVLMESLHDYDYNRQMADGPARVIFTNNK